MKKIAKIIGLVLAALILITNTVIPSFAQGESYLSYSEFSDHAKLIKCNTSARGVVNIPSTYNGLPVSVIGDEAFANCNLITEITIPSSVTSVGQKAFDSCSSLEKVTFKGSECQINAGAFVHCSRLSSVTLPSALKTVSEEMFYDCASLEEITIPSSVTLIGKEAFKTCGALKSVFIPASVKAIGANAFIGCNAITYFSVAESNPVYSVSGGCLYGPLKSPYDSEVSYAVTDKTLIQYPNGKTATSIVVDSDTLHIADYAFGDNAYLSKIVLPQGLLSIENYAFFNCSALSDINIPSSVSSIGLQAFAKTSALKTVTVPGSVSSLENVFYSSAVETVVLQNGVETIGTRCFENCKQLKNVSIPKTVSKIGIGAFYGCTGLETLTVPSCVTSVGSKAFGNCESIVLSVEEGSTAHTYAQNNGISFVLLGSSAAVKQISIYQMPSKTSYYYKDSVDTDGLVLLVTKSDGSTELVSSGYSISPSSLNKTGTVSVEVTYGGCATRFNVSVSYAWWQWIIRILLLGIIWY